MKPRALTCAADYAERAESDNREINRLADIVADDGERIAAITAQRDKLAGLLRECWPKVGLSSDIGKRIDAALAELEKKP